jgi:hypothetical protein
MCEDSRPDEKKYALPDRTECKVNLMVQNEKMR